MLTIHKQQLQVTTKQYITLPEGSEILSLQIQGGVPTLWYMCDSNRLLYLLDIKMYGTGWDMSDIKTFPNFIGTVQIDSYVWHYFSKALQ